MQGEFSLSQYLAVLRRRWHVVVAAVGITLLAAIGFSLLQPVSYEAKVVLAAQAPKYAWRLDASFQTVVEDLRLDRRSDFTVLLSDKILGQRLAEKVIARMGETLPGDLRDAKKLRRTVKISNGQGRLLYLTARGRTPQLAQALADAWVAVWIEETDARYGQGADKAKFEAELAQAQARFDAADQAWRAFQARTGQMMELGGELTTLQDGTLAAGLPLLQQRLVLNNSDLAEYQLALARVRLLAEQARAAQEKGAPFGDLPLEVLSTPLLLERGQLTRARVDALAGDYAKLLAALANEEKSLTETLARLRTETDAIQTEMADQFQERSRILREYGLSEEAMRALRRKVTEILIQQDVTGAPLIVLDPANLPTEKATPDWIVNLGLACVLGLLAGLALALGREFVRERV
jgi:uncharacterized protein involved in exopolysaccharide biosynthesis